jgi:hypothetical protein
MLILLPTLGAACTRSRDLAGMTDSTFVATMAALRHIERDEQLDSAARTTARATTLQERDLTPEELERAARALASDPARAETLWARIDTLSRMRLPP